MIITPVPSSIPSRGRHAAAETPTPVGLSPRAWKRVRQGLTATVVVTVIGAAVTVGLGGATVSPVSPAAVVAAATAAPIAPDAGAGDHHGGHGAHGPHR